MDCRGENGKKEENENDLRPFPALRPLRLFDPTGSTYMATWRGQRPLETSFCPRARSPRSHRRATDFSKEEGEISSHKGYAAIPGRSIWSVPARQDPG